MTAPRPGRGVDEALDPKDVSLLCAVAVAAQADRDSGGAKKERSSLCSNAHLNTSALRGRMKLGHADVQTMMIYTHVLNRVGKGVRSPL